MTTFATVGEFDLRTPITVREISRISGPATNAGDLIVQGRSYNASEPRSWEITAPDENGVTRDRALSLHALTGFGAAPLRWTPPNEATEISVFIDEPTGMSTVRTSPQHHTISITLTESK